MATLEKIRSQKKLLFAVIFGALVLFIVSIIDNPASLFSDTTSAAKVNGTKISMEDVNRRSQEMQADAQQQLAQTNAQRRAQGLPEQQMDNTDYEVAALNDLIIQAALAGEYSKLGIVVTDDEISAATVGPNALPQVISAFYRKYGVTPEQLRAALDNPEANGISAEDVALYTSEFARFEQEVESQMLSGKFQFMIDGGINANKLDAKALYDEAATSYVLALANQSLFGGEPATDADVEKYYNKHRESFKVNQPSRHVRYVTTTIAPTTQDSRDAIAKAQKVADEANAGEVDFNEAIASGNYTLKHTIGNIETSNAAREAGLRAFLEEAQPGEVRVLDTQSAPYIGERHVTLAQLVSRENKINGGKIKQVIYDGTVAGDTIVKQLNAGVNADSIKGVARVIPSSAITFQDIDASIVDSLRTLGLGTYLGLAQGALAFESYDDPEDIYEYYTARHDIDASRETREKLNGAMREFLTVASRADLFNDENATANNLVIYDDILDNSRYMLGDANNAIPDSKEIVAWAMSAKPGEVSKLYTSPDGNRIFAAAVVEEFKDYIPVNIPMVRQSIEFQAALDRDAEAAIEKYAGKANTFDEYVSLMGIERIDTVSGVNLSNPRYAELGALRAAKAGDVVGPVRMAAGVVVANVLEANESTMPFDEAAEAQRFEQQVWGAIGRAGILNFVLGNKPVKYEFLRFHGGK